MKLGYRIDGSKIRGTSPRIPATQTNTDNELRSKSVAPQTEKPGGTCMMPSREKTCREVVHFRRSMLFAVVTKVNPVLLLPANHSAETGKKPGECGFRTVPLSEHSYSCHRLTLLSLRLTSRTISSIWNGRKWDDSFSSFARHSSNTLPSLFSA